MPKTTRSGDAKQSELPSTLRRSPKKAQRTFAKAHDSALESYDGDEQRANRVGYSALKHTFQKVGDHWEGKRGGRKGPSDPQAAGGARTNRRTRGGVDAGAPKSELYDQAKKLDIPGRSAMSKTQLLDALQKASRRATRKARQK